MSVSSANTIIRGLDAYIWICISDSAGFVARYTYGGFLVQQFGSGPGVVDPDSGIAADPEGYHWAVELFGQLFEVDPGFIVGQEVGVAYDWQRSYTGRL